MRIYKKGQGVRGKEKQLEMRRRFRKAKGEGRQADRRAGGRLYVRRAGVRARGKVGRKEESTLLGREARVFASERQRRGGGKFCYGKFGHTGNRIR